MSKKEIEIRPVMLVVDMQNCFAASNGSYDKIGFNIKHYQKIIPLIKKTVSKIRKMGVPIIHAKAIHEPDGSDNLDNIHKLLFKSRLEWVEGKPICVRDTWDGNFVKELQPHKGDVVIEKRRDSSFFGTNLDVLLRLHKANMILVAGVDTYMCVESTARDGFLRGFDVVVFKDLVASKYPDFHKASLREINDAYGVVMASKEFLRRFKKTSKKKVFKLDIGGIGVIARQREIFEQR